MLGSASDYTHVDVSNIAVGGNILPARDMAGNGAWRALKAEDAAYLAEMGCERDGSYRSTFDANTGLGPAPIRLEWRDWLRYVPWYLSSAFDVVSRHGAHYGPVDPDYIFDSKHDVDGSDDIPSLYPLAFGLLPSLDYDYLSQSGNNPIVLSADDVRRMFYDMSRLVRFWRHSGGTEGGSYTHTVDSHGIEPANNTHLETTYSGSRWMLQASWMGSACYYVAADSVVSATLTDITCSGNPRWFGYVTEMIAFVRLETEIRTQTGSGAGEQVVDENYVDIIPVECVKSGATWNLPSGFFSDSVAEEAVRRHGGDPTRPTMGQYPEVSTGMTFMSKKMEVDWSVSNIVCKCTFPSDFSSIDWTWRP